MKLLTKISIFVLIVACIICTCDAAAGRRRREGEEPPPPPPPTPAPTMDPNSGGVEMVMWKLPYGEMWADWIKKLKDFLDKWLKKSL